MKNFEIGLADTLVYEGGYSNNPRDLGGSTEKGVTQTTYDRYRDLRHFPHRDVRQITPYELNDIYNSEYWQPVSCDQLPTGVDIFMFDTAVNSGLQEAGVLLQRAVNMSQAKVTIPVDGKVGPATIAAANYCNAQSLIANFAAVRLAFLRGLTKEWTTFGGGWTERVNGYEAKAIALYKASVAGGPLAIKSIGGNVPPPASSGVSQSGLVGFLRDAWQRWFGG